MMYSLYGGRQGKDFKISKIFSNRVALEQDLNLGYYSTVGVGEIVCISYGLPNDENGQYKNNKEIDLNRYEKTYNLTFWEKVYGNETNEVQEDNGEIVEVDTNSEIDTKIYQINSGISGFGYRLIGSSTGNTPVFDVVTEAIAPDANPEVKIEPANIDNPLLTFSLPKAVRFYTGDGYYGNDEEDVLCRKLKGIYKYTITQLQTIKDTNIFGDFEKTKFLMQKGDIYIDSTTGNMYKYNDVLPMSGSSDVQYQFIYQGRIASEKFAASIDQDKESFGANGQLNDPEITIDYINFDEEIGKKFNFSLPKFPTTFEVTATSIGYNQNPEVIIEPKENSSVYKMTMEIPQGEALKMINQFDVEYTEDSTMEISLEKQLMVQLNMNKEFKSWITTEWEKEANSSFRQGTAGVGLNYYKTGEISLTTSYMLLFNPQSKIVDVKNVMDGCYLISLTGNINGMLINLKDIDIENLKDENNKTYNITTINSLIENLYKEIKTLKEQLIWQPSKMVEEEGGQTE